MRNKVICFSSNLLIPSGSEQQRANYLIGIHSAFSLPNGKHCHGEPRYGKFPSTFVRVTFCGLVVIKYSCLYIRIEIYVKLIKRVKKLKQANTAVQARTCNPIYNEQISMVEMFPNMSQLIRLEIYLGDNCFNRVLCAAQLRLDQISHDGENGTYI